MCDFDGGNTYIPIVHPHTDISRYAVLGSILSYGYMSCGILPNRLSFPVLVYTLLGCGVIIPDPLMIESFIDYVSNYESSIFRQALIESKKQLHRSFTPQLQDSLITILGSMGCRELPTPETIQKLILEVARYELTTKPSILSALEYQRSIILIGRHFLSMNSMSCIELLVSLIDQLLALLTHQMI